MIRKLNGEGQSAVSPVEAGKNFGGAFFWLAAFYFVYCARPEDWITPLRYIPLAKITGLFAFLGFVSSIGKTKRTFRDLPIESRYLLAMIILLFASGFLSPVWKGGAVNHTIDFGKVFIAWALTFLLVTDFERLRRIIFIQAVSVPAICAVSIIKGHSRPRLEGVIGGIYSNPNDLAFAIVLSLPLVFAFFLSTKSFIRKGLWAIGMLLMVAALFLTASRAGFITLVLVGALSMWHFAIKGRRMYLIVACGVLGVLVMAVAGGQLRKRMQSFTGDELDSRAAATAYGSYEERLELVHIAFGAIEHYPILGIGVNNFVSYSGKWREVHVTYLQVAAEGGIPVLILFMMFFRRGFSNVTKLLKMRHLGVEHKLFIGGLHTSLVGFVIGALFAPEAYQFFPYFAVAYSSALLAIVQEQGETAPQPARSSLTPRWRSTEAYASRRSPKTLAPSR